MNDETSKEVLPLDVPSTEIFPVPVRPWKEGERETVEVSKEDAEAKLKARTD